MSKEKRITYEKNGLTAVFREKMGADVLDERNIHLLIGTHIAKQLGLGFDKLPNRFWTRIIFVTNVMQQTVSLSGEDRFDIPGTYATDDEITDFYDFMMTLSADMIDFFTGGLAKFDAAPLETGEQDASASVPAQEVASLETAV